MLRRSVALVSLVLLASCSSDPAPATKDTGFAGRVDQDITWEDGQKLGGVVSIPEGVTVTIAPGATIKCSEATQILIGGTLRVDAKDNPATITCDKWKGITAAQNGSLAIDGLTIENAAIGFETTVGAGDCTVKNSKALTSVRPFKVGVNSKLTLDHFEGSTVTTLGNFDTSISEVYGELVARYVKYEAQNNEGIMVKEGGKATITDSTLVAHGGYDLVSSYKGDTLNVSYTTMSGGHCGPHIQGVKQATFDHITSAENQFGITIYGAEKVTVTNSNLGGGNWLDMQGDHGPVTFTNNYLVPTPAGTDPPAHYIPGDGTTGETQPLIDGSRATARFMDAAPRPEK